MASPTLNNCKCASPNQVSMPIRKMLTPATIQTAPAIKSKVCLLTLKLIVFSLLRLANANVRKVPELSLQKLNVPVSRL